MSVEKSTLAVRKFRIEATQRWLDTGIVTNADEEPLLITCVGGKWTSNPNEGFTGPEGNSKLLAKRGYALPGAPEGALIGRVNDIAFLIGEENAMPEAGRLWLTINDDLDAQYGDGYSDNLGSIEVEVHGGRTDWIEIQLIGEDGMGVKGQRCEVLDGAGKLHEKRTDLLGAVRFEGVPDTEECEISFPDLDGRAWESLVNPRDPPSTSGSLASPT